MINFLIDCGHAVIRIEIDDSHAHLTVIAPSITEENYHQPAESAMAIFGPTEARAIIDALGKVKQGLKAVSKDQH